MLSTWTSVGHIVHATSKQPSFSWFGCTHFWAYSSSSMDANCNLGNSLTCLEIWGQCQWKVGLGEGRLFSRDVLPWSTPFKRSISTKGTVLCLLENSCNLGRTPALTLKLVRLVGMDEEGLRGCHNFRNHLDSTGPKVI